MAELSVILERIAERPAMFFALVAIMVAGVSFIVMGFLQKYSKNPWFCKKMGWHISPGVVGFNGCSMTGTCPRCHESVMKDGQGNWF